MTCWGCGSPSLITWKQLMLNKSEQTCTKMRKKQFTRLKRWGALRCWDLQRCWLPGSTADDPHTADWSRPAQHTRKPRHYRVPYMDRHHGPYLSIQGTQEPRHYRVPYMERHHGPYLSIQGTRKPPHYRVPYMEKHHGPYLSIQGKRTKHSNMAVLHSISRPDCPKWTFESCRNPTTGTAILCPADCISDVMSKAGKCGWSIKGQKPFSALHWNEGTNMAALWAAQIEHKKSTSFVQLVHLSSKQYVLCITTDRRSKWSLRMKTCPGSMFSGQLVSWT